MTREEAIRILDPQTAVDTLAEIEYYHGFKGIEAVSKALDEACILAVEALREQEERKRKQTNADRIRAMTDEELANFVHEGCHYIEEECTMKGCVKCILELLQQPVKEMR